MPQFSLYDKNSENYELLYMHKYQYKAYELKILDTASNFRIVGSFLIVYAYTSFGHYCFSHLIIK